ncbi:hypothetical protein BpHYR1_021006 [Brachionus plicatilis]|uniref:Uncharacterized protein n=1 Tax=Brachionus plicatilis TaxID=10195 RepID=A0A3M7T0T0_BRAPC|nr:hypothetical protein BpHYR1_021006 [Brachionus plicatilis]
MELILPFGKVLDFVVGPFGTRALVNAKVTSWDGDGRGMVIRLDYLVKGNEKAILIFNISSSVIFAKKHLYTFTYLFAEFDSSVPSNFQSRVTIKRKKSGDQVT